MISSTRPRSKRGLGLYIAKGIVEGHGGQISVESAIGRASTFIFTIPTRAVPEIETPAPPLPARAPAVGGQSMKAQTRRARAASPQPEGHSTFEAE